MLLKLLPPAVYAVASDAVEHQTLENSSFAAENLSKFPHLEINKIDLWWSIPQKFLLERQLNGCAYVAKVSSNIFVGFNVLLWIKLNAKSRSIYYRKCREYNQPARRYREKAFGSFEVPSFFPFCSLQLSQKQWLLGNMSLKHEESLHHKSNPPPFHLRL